MRARGTQQWSRRAGSSGLQRPPCRVVLTSPFLQLSNGSRAAQQHSVNSRSRVSHAGALRTCAHAQSKRRQLLTAVPHCEDDPTASGVVRASEAVCRAGPPQRPVALSSVGVTSNEITIHAAPGARSDAGNCDGRLVTRRTRGGRRRLVSGVSGNEKLVPATHCPRLGRFTPDSFVVRLCIGRCVTETNQKETLTDVGCFEQEKFVQSRTPAR